MNPTFAQRLDTNYVPSDEEIPSIRAIINDRQHVVDKIDEEIQAIETVLRGLNERRASHMKYIQQHRALLSPMKRLHIDLLSSIFLACTVANPHARRSSTGSSNMTYRHPSVVLSHVCRQWRDISLGTPLLWSKIELYPPPCPTTHTYIPVNPGMPHRAKEDFAERWRATIVMLKLLLETWISRSADCPLSVRFCARESIVPHLTFGGSSPPEDLQNTRECLGDFVDILCRTSIRWREVGIELSIASHHSPLLQLLLLSPDKVPIIEAFKFVLLFNPTEVDPDLEERKRGLISKIGLFRGPSLRSLAITCLWQPIAELPVDWSSLTELTFGGYNISLYDGAYGVLPNPSGGYGPVFDIVEASQLLKACPRLVHCSFAMRGLYELGFPTEHPDAQTVTITEQVHLPFLQSLRLQGSNISSSFASSLVLPSLNNLSITGYAHLPQSQDASCIVEFIRCFGSQLKTVLFNSAALTPQALEYCLERLTSVTELVLISQPINPYSFGANGELIEGPPQGLLTSELLTHLTPRFSSDDEKGERPLAPCFCPKLERFGYQLTSLEVGECDFLEFIEARRRPTAVRAGDDSVVPIRHVSVKFNSFQEVDLKKVLEERNVDISGLTLEMTHPAKPQMAHYTNPGSYGTLPFPPLFDTSYFDPFRLL